MLQSSSASTIPSEYVTWAVVDWFFFSSSSWATHFRNNKNKDVARDEADTGQVTAEPMGWPGPAILLNCCKEKRVMVAATRRGAKKRTPSETFHSSKASCFI